MTGMITEECPFCGQSMLVDRHDTGWLLGLPTLVCPAAEAYDMIFVSPGITEVLKP